MPNSIIKSARNNYHQRLIDENVLAIVNGIATNADRSSSPSKFISGKMCEIMGVGEARTRLEGQTSGRLFEEITMRFVQETFPYLQNLRPGNWIIQRLGNQSNIKTSDFVQYEHLSSLAMILRDNPILATSIGNDYVVAPDIIVARKPYSDQEINEGQEIVDNDIAHHSPIRLVNNNKPILHASISAKWTMRSDRSQNSRTEALNLIRNRKGSLPHIMVVTGEPMPSRIASLALGTGDIDCIYHFALDELIQAINCYALDGHEDTKSLLDTLIDGKRLKDISDLPLDLAI